MLILCQRYYSCAQGVRPNACDPRELLECQNRFNRICVQNKLGNHKGGLSDPTEIPPCVFCGIADYSCYTPASFPKSGLSQSKDMP